MSFIPLPAPGMTKVVPRACDYVRLRASLRQLTEGVAALHAAGKLHRDLKPSNVLVTPEGRVVILDFGLAVEWARDPLEGASRDRLAGTLTYMSPEQAAGEELTRASDWYSVGVMLYQSMTGKLPFEGTRLQVFHDKQTEEPQSASTRAGWHPGRPCAPLRQAAATQSRRTSARLRNLGALGSMVAGRAGSGSDWRRQPRVISFHRPRS
jgi:serine/threonine protein kinase